MPNDEESNEHDELKIKLEAMSVEELRQERATVSLNEVEAVAFLAGNSLNKKVQWALMVQRELDDWLDIYVNPDPLSDPPFPGAPPFDLVQLSTLPLEQWKGRAVFHPGSQQGGDAYWRNEDCPFFCREADKHGPADDPGTWYDVGVVVEWEAENWRQETDNPDAHEVYFLTGHGHTLHYGAGNLWTPRP